MWLVSDDGLSENGVYCLSGLDNVRRDVDVRDGSWAQASFSGKGMLVGAGVPTGTAPTTGCTGIIGAASGATI